MYANIFNKLFQPFLDKNSFLIINSSVKNYTISSYDFTNISNILPNEKILLNNMIINDSHHFNRIRNELDNQKIKNNLTSIYCLLFNECINIKNEEAQKKLINSALRKYLSNILDEISQNLLNTLEDKCSNNTTYNKSQKYKRNKNDLKITIELLFLIFVYMINKYKNIIDNTNNNNIVKGINIKKLKTNKIQEELYFILILQQNLYWMEILLHGLLLIFQKLKNNKFRMLINADTEFNKLDENFKSSCFNCFLPLFGLIKKYSTTNISHFTIIEYIFDIKKNNNIHNSNNNDNNNNNNNDNNEFLPLKINKIEKTIFKLFECFIYEFLYDIDSLWKYFDNLNFSISKTFPDDEQIIYGFGLYLCHFIKVIAFIRNDNLTKIDFFNFYIFSYNLITNYFSKLNSHLYNLFVGLYDIIRKKIVITASNINLNYLQSLSNSLKDMLFHFMVFSFYNDSLKDIYVYNEILLNSIITHCFIKVIIPIYSLIINGNTNKLLIDILQILIDNVNKYKIILPLKCHFHKELFTHNFLLILDYYLVNYEKELTCFLNEKKNDKEIYFEISVIKNKFNKTLYCLFDHYNCINFIYSNHIMFMLNKILNNSNIIKSNNLDNIIMRYIPNDKNFLHYKDIKLNIITYKDKNTPNINNNCNILEFIEPINNINVNKGFYTKNIYDNYSCCNYVGFALEDNFDNDTLRLIRQIELEGYEENVIDNKHYLIKSGITNKNSSYATILGHNGEYIEILGIDRNLKENILNIMENIQYTDKYMFTLIQEKIINNDGRDIKVSHSFYNNLKYYDLKFKLDYFEYQNQIKQLLL